MLIIQNQHIKLYLGEIKLKKDKIISKFNMKNYSNELERVLAKKTFSSSTKNLLSDMLYKIENSYEDYKDVKVEVNPKNKML